MTSALQPEKLFQLPGSSMTESSPDCAREHGIIASDMVNELDSKVPAEVIDQSAGEELPNEAAQDGVMQAEAITLSWTKKSLAAAYIL